MMQQTSEAYKAMFDKVDFYKDVITALESYLDSQIQQCRNDVDRNARQFGTFHFETAGVNGMLNAYADVRVILRDLVSGTEIDWGQL